MFTYKDVAFNPASAFLLEFNLDQAFGVHKVHLAVMPRMICHGA